ncbi:ribosome maturation factor RimP [Thermomonospora echinospora]|uniref:ribosome maturation factor RimP n=1 Tax=Thermomonospora echinospora TaxID=1992 RepID=UPI00389A52D2
MQAELTRLVGPLVAEQGLDLEELDVKPAGRRRLVRVVVDADGGVSLDDVASLNQTVSSALDDTDVMGNAPYVLEVTSPGVDRPLTEPRHWRRATGRLVRTALADGGQVEGRVVAADDDAVVLEIAGRRRRFGHGELGRGRVQVEFRRPEERVEGRAGSGDDDDEPADPGTDEAGN